MSAGFATALRPVAPDVDPDVVRLRSAVDGQALSEAGWDPERRMFAPSPEHPVFGFAECMVNGCIGVGLSPTEMCDACRRRWRVHHPELSRAEFIAVQRPRIEGRRKREVLCRVCCLPGFERPAYGPTGLCLQCYKSFKSSKLVSVEEWIAGGQPRGGGWRSSPRPPARPRPSLGWCERCGRRASNQCPVSCVACMHRWKLLGRPDWDVWRREHPLREDTNPRVLVLSGVSERLQLEFLVGVQDAMNDERRFNAWGGLTRVARMLSVSGVRSVLDVEECPIRADATRRAFIRVRWAVQRALVDRGRLSNGVKTANNASSNAG